MISTPGTRDTANARHIATPLPPDVVSGLWALCLFNLAFGDWLLAVRFGAAPCGGVLCTLVTLGDHPTMVLALSECCAAALVVAIPVTTGPSSANGLRLAIIVVATVCGAIALAGVTAVLVGGALVLTVAGALILGVIDRL